MTVNSNFEGKHAVVTGGATGLGLAVTKRLLDGGARVSVWSAPGAAMDRLAQGRVERLSAHSVDIRSGTEVQGAVEASVATFGGIDILVNNAGIAGPSALTWETPESEWRTVLDVNLTGTFICCKAVIPTMLAQPAGRIVNIASISGKDGNALICAYAASKAAVISLTKTLGKELATSSILVNCVTPGPIKTTIFDEWPDSHVQSLVAKVPMGRFGRPEELASMVSWLCSEEVSFSTGAVFDLSGGRAVY